MQNTIADRPIEGLTDAQVDRVADRVIERLARRVSENAHGIRDDLRRALAGSDAPPPASPADELRAVIRGVEQLPPRPAEATSPAYPPHNLVSSVSEPSASPSASEAKQAPR